MTRILYFLVFDEIVELHENMYRKPQAMHQQPGEKPVLEGEGAHIAVIPPIRGSHW